VLLVLALALPASAAADPVPLDEFGSSGTDAGQFNIPSGVAVDGAGNVYVADFNLNRINVFGADGSFTHAFGWGVDTGAAAFEVCTTASTCQVGIAGGGAGQLNGPEGVALDSAGNLYVADESNSRIDVFDPMAPSFIRASGWGVDTGASAFEVCTTASTCQAGSSGGGAGQLSSPDGIGLDGAGNIYVSDTANHRVSVFGPGGTSFTHAFGWGVDTGASMFEICTTTSTCQEGIVGGGAGQLDTPVGIAVDAAGALYVADVFHQRIDVFDTAGPSFTRAFGWDVADPNGGTAFEVCPTQGTCRAGDAGGGAGQLNLPWGVALDGTGGVYVSDQTNNRVSVFAAAGPSFTHAFGWGVDTGASAFEVCTTASSCQAGIFGGGAGQLSGPLGVAVDCRGAVWVADNGNQSVQRFGELGTPLPPCPPAPPPPAPGPGGSASPPPAAGPTGKRAAAVKRCKKKFRKGPKRKKCIRKARKLPV
jgi:tripartite motif-containing protein 71